PPSHFENGYADAEGWRQGSVFFPAGGATINGVSKPGEIVWSRVYIEDDVLNVDIGRGSSVRLPEEESQRRKNATNPEWPVMHAVLHGVNRDQFMARNKANHVQVAYAPDAETADKALIAKAAMFENLGVRVFLCGETPLSYIMGKHARALCGRAYPLMGLSRHSLSAAVAAARCVVSQPFRLV